MSTRQTNIDLFNYKRRATVAVKVGALMMGSDYPVRVQSMTNTSTRWRQTQLQVLHTDSFLSPRKM